MSAARTPSRVSVARSSEPAGGAPQASHTRLMSGRGLLHSGQRSSVVVVVVTSPPWPASARPFPTPARAVAAHVHVGEGAMAAAGLVDAHAADQGGIARLHPLHGGGEHFRVLGVDAAVAVDVVHAPVAVIVQENVRGIPV